jgi:hypothetical protein
MAGFLLRLRRAMQQARYAPHVVRVTDMQDAMPLAYWHDKAPLRLELPTESLRMQGAFAYGPDHPFCRALSDGPDALTAFYDAFQPQTIAAMHGLHSTAKGADLPQWILPWRLVRNPKPPRGEKHLSARHGVAFYGPCSTQKIELEINRLQSARASITQQGYTPDRYGDIEGQFLTDGKRVVFMVLGGKHRASVLAGLGQSHLPVRLRPGVMPLIDSRTALHWPLVADGQMDVSLAQAVLGSYLDGRGLSDVLGRR